MNRRVLFIALTIGLVNRVYAEPANANSQETDAPGYSFTILHSFGDGIVPNDGEFPNTSVIQGPASNFYGVTWFGGSAGKGTIYKMTPDGVVTILHSFGDGTVENEGADPQPIEPLTLGADGNLYGTTNHGGSANKGAIFKTTTSGAVTVLHSFDDGSIEPDGVNPGGIIQAQDGDFYGGTLYTSTGRDSGGTIFKMTPDGQITILHRFGDRSVPNDGAGPNGNLVQGTDGIFYGVTTEGGAANKGTIFKMTPKGAVTILHSFGSPDDGEHPGCGFVQGKDGDFYGTIDSGAVGDNGYVYKMTADGTITQLHTFGDGTVPNDGTSPESQLIQGKDGNFYGTTNNGGTDKDGNGVIYRMSPSGEVTILHMFVGNDQLTPVGSLIQDSAGNIFGVTRGDEHGEKGCRGNVFKLTLPHQPTAPHDQHRAAGHA